jgi:hypothetical protein
MSFGKMNAFIELVTAERGTDAEGFSVSGDRVVASLRAYREDRHGTAAWANRAAFSTASAMFRFRVIPGVVVDAALGLSPAKVDRKGSHNVKVGFSEPRRGGGVNAKIANILEYGTSVQRPRPFLKPARASSRKAAIDAMKARLEREIDGL